jgi:hypothetical protein
MHTILELLINMSHSTIPGIFGVLAIFLFMFGIIGAGMYRVKEALDHEEHGSH